MFQVDKLSSNRCPPVAPIDSKHFPLFSIALQLSLFSVTPAGGSKKQRKNLTPPETYIHYSALIPNF